MNEKLKKCPFCGGKAKSNVGYALEEYVASVWCIKCQAEVCCIDDDKEDNALNGAIAKWNRRAE